MNPEQQTHKEQTVEDSEEILDYLNGIRLEIIEGMKYGEKEPVMNLSGLIAAFRYGLTQSSRERDELQKQLFNAFITTLLVSGAHTEDSLKAKDKELLLEVFREWVGELRDYTSYFDVKIAQTTLSKLNLK